MPLKDSAPNPACPPTPPDAPPEAMGWLRFGWPDVSTLPGARTAAFHGIAAAAAMAAWTLAAATWASLRGTRPLGFLDGSACLEALVFAAVAYGIHRESRTASVAALLLMAWDRLFQTGPTFWAGGIAVDVPGLVLLGGLVMGIRGTFALHRLRAQGPEAAPGGTPEEPSSGGKDLERLRGLHHQGLLKDDEFELLRQRSASQDS